VIRRQGAERRIHEIKIRQVAEINSCQTQQRSTLHAFICASSVAVSQLSGDGVRESLEATFLARRRKLETKGM